MSSNLTPTEAPRLRALTLWPEWAWAIHHLDKRVENRTWALPVGEWFALHAGKHLGGRPGHDAGVEAVTSVRYMATRAGWNLAPVFPTLPSPIDRDRKAASAILFSVATSAIVGLFRVTRTEPPDRGDLTGWRVPEQVGNVFEYAPLASPRWPAFSTIRPSR